MIVDKNAKISYIDLIKEDLAIFHVTPDDIPIPDFKPGQFLTLGVMVPTDEKINRSAYSIASPPYQKKFFELVIRWIRRPIPGKRTTQIFNKKEGDSVFWIPPAGTFTINEKFESGLPDQRRMVLIGGDIGLAPFISYCQYLKHINSKREIIVLHGVEFIDELIYKKLLTELEDESLDKGRNNWNFKYRSTISRPEEEINRSWSGNKGKVDIFLTLHQGKDKTLLEDLVGEKITPDNTSFYVCGWQDTIKSVLDVLIPRGFVTERNKRKNGTFDIKVESYG